MESPNLVPDEVAYPMVQSLVPHLPTISLVPDILTADLRYARHLDDPERFMADALALLRYLDQLRRGLDSAAASWLRIHLYSLNSALAVFDEIEHTLMEQPGFLTDADLRSLAHQLAKVQTGADLFPTGQRLGLQDFLQSIYAPDGRLTPEGLHSMTAMLRFGDNSLNLIAAAEAPVLMITRGTPATVLVDYDRAAKEAFALLHLPLRESCVSWESYDRRTTESRSWWILRRFIPSPSMATIAERYLGRRDGLLVAIALEVHRRQHGQYPLTLEALSPDLLPQVPSDRITGKALRYRLIDGKPLIYSVGADRDDDGGRPAQRRPWQQNAYLAAEWFTDPSSTPDGDWILYPCRIEASDADCQGQ